MLQDLITDNRALLIERCRLMAAGRSEAKFDGDDFSNGIPMFLDQLIKTLTIEQVANRDHQAMSTDGPNVVETAALHGRDLLEHGFTLEQVVRDYGNVCQAVTNLALESGEDIQVHEFRTFNRCLDDAIAGAVTEYARQSAVSRTNEAQTSNSRLGALAHELRNHLQTATLVVNTIKCGNVGISGATAAVLDRSLQGMRHLIDQSLADVRLNAGVPPHFELLHLAVFLRDVEATAALDAQARGLYFTVAPVASDIAVYADAAMLASAVCNLLQNAFKFTQRHTRVGLRAYCKQGRVLIDVEDHCGGLPAGAVDRLFLPFVQLTENRSGLGLGLDICRRNVEAIHGTLKVRDIPGSGCVFTIDLPRHVNF